MHTWNIYEGNADHQGNRNYIMDENENAGKRRNEASYMYPTEMPSIGGHSYCTDKETLLAIQEGTSSAM